jgi:hypothetical protein
MSPTTIRPVSAADRTAVEAVPKACDDAPSGAARELCDTGIR